MVDVPVLSRFGKRTMKLLNCKFKRKHQTIVHGFYNMMSDLFCISSQENACCTSRTSLPFSTGASTPSQWWGGFSLLGPHGPAKHSMGNGSDQDRVFLYPCVPLGWRCCIQRTEWEASISGLRKLVGQQKKIPKTLSTRSFVTEMSLGSIRTSDGNQWPFYMLSWDVQGYHDRIMWNCGPTWNRSIDFSSLGVYGLYHVLSRNPKKVSLG